MEWTRVLGAAFGAYVFGAIWYMSMSKPWVRAAGIPVDAAGRPQGNGSVMPFVAGFLAQLVVAGMMRHIFNEASIETLAKGFMAGAGIGAFLITPWVGMNYAFSMRPMTLWLIDSVNAVVGCTIMGLVLVLI
jgi:hypothetical protein